MLAHTTHLKRAGSHHETVRSFSSCIQNECAADIDSSSSSIRRVPSVGSVLSHTSDPYHGHKETAQSCAHFITNLFLCSDSPPADRLKPNEPAPSLAVFIAYAIYRTQLPPCVIVTALALLQRLKSRLPASARGSAGHNLFITAFMLASKVLNDDTYSNISWTVAAQNMFALRNLNAMERDMCGFLDWDMHVGAAELKDIQRQLKRNFSGSESSTVSESRKTTSDRRRSPPEHAYPTPSPSPPASRPSRTRSHSRPPENVSRRGGVEQARQAELLARFYPGGMK